MVMFIYRDDTCDENSKREHKVEIIVAKQRNGCLGTVELNYLEEFGNYEPVSIDFD